MLPVCVSTSLCLVIIVSTWVSVGAAKDRQSQPCADQWRKWKGHCYLRLPSTGDWGHCRGRCQEMGGDLVAIDTKRELQFIGDLAGESMSWLGLSDGDDGDGQYTWVTGGVPVPQPPASPWAPLVAQLKARGCAYLIHRRRINLLAYVPASCGEQFVTFFICEKSAARNVTQTKKHVVHQEL